MTQYVAYHEQPGAIELHGPARQFWSYKGQEVILSGPYETGKTLACLLKLHALLVKYPGAQAFIMRQTYKSLVATALATYERKILPIPIDDPQCPIKKYGGTKPEFYLYPNGSKILCAGLDNPDKILSGEFDFGYVNQAEEISLDAWEKLVTRCSGRAGNAPYTQLMADCNPSYPSHWILHRRSLKLFEQRHQHNPSLYDQTTGELTALGERSMAVLHTLTGLRRKRGLEGLWVAAEGVVYDNFDPAVHIIDRADLPELTQRFMAIDFGYTNPFVAQWWGTDHDGRAYLYRELYMSKRTVREHCNQIKQLESGLSPAEWHSLSEDDKRAAWKAGEPISARVADHDAEDRATLEENGISTVKANKDIRVGIETVQHRLQVQADGKPRLFLVRDALVEADPELYREYPGDLHPCCTEHEFPVYTWPEDREGRANKEIPVDVNNHGLDATRYMMMLLKNYQREIRLLTF